jgi:OOP family OmpA-OmpF porin
MKKTFSNRLLSSFTALLVFISAGYSKDLIVTCDRMTVFSGLIVPDTLTPNSEKAYAKFDFIPGDQVLFEDDFRGESTDEIPSFWVASSGKVEVTRINGELVMGMLDKSPVVYPRQKGNNEYPDRITCEFDFLWRNNSKTWEQAWKDGNTAGGDRLIIRFAKNTDYYENEKVKAELGDYVEDLDLLSGGRIKFRDFEGAYSSGAKVADADGLFEDLNGKWVHVSIAINERSLKVYLNQERVLNASVSGGKVFTFQFSSTASTYESGSQVFIRNVRIAKGGADPYRQLTADGRFIARGIHFDVGRSTMRPESMGTLNGIVKMMHEHPELKFEVGGHTDSDGDDASNLKLSQDRAQAVREKLVSMGIDAGRLTSKGYGEAKPLSPNTTPEGKANNRRVELVKQ